MKTHGRKMSGACWPLAMKRTGPVTPRDENLTPVASRRPMDTAPLADPMEVQVGDISG